MASSSAPIECYVIDDDEEDTEVTGGKSLSEIVQLLRTSTKLSRNTKGTEEPSSDMPKNSKLFLWINKLISDCRECIIKLNIPLSRLLSLMIPHLENEVNNVLKKPKRAAKLRSELTTFLALLHTLFSGLNHALPTELSNFYFDQMSQVLALYIDVELSAARYQLETAQKISNRISSVLHINLCSIIEPMLDAILRSKLFIKKYSNTKINQKIHDICCPIIERLIAQIPKLITETSYVRYLLAYKVWKKLVSGREHKSLVTNLAVQKLVPPPDFIEKLKSGVYSNVLPYVTKSDKHRLTWFFMVSPFNISEKAQVFLKDGMRSQHTVNIETPYPKAEVLLECNSFDKSDTLGQLWSELDSYEEDSLENLFGSEDDFNLKEYIEKVIVDKSKENAMKPPITPLSFNIDKLAFMKLKTNHVGPKMLNNVPSDGSRVENSISNIFSMLNAEEVLNNTDYSEKTNAEMSRCKPCATVEPEQSRETEADSQSARRFAMYTPDVAMVSSSGMSMPGTDSRSTNQHQPEEHLVLEIAREEIIGEINSEESATLAFPDLSGQENITAQDILKVPNVSQGTEPAAVKSNVTTNTESQKEVPQTAIAPNQKYFGCLISPERNPLLDSVETNTDFIPLDRRQDTFSCNDTLLSSFLADDTVDEISDDESAYTQRRKLAGGGKVTAFREQMEDSAGEECESPPCSRGEHNSSAELTDTSARWDPRYTTLPAVSVTLNDMNLKNIDDSKGNQDSSQKSSSHDVKRCQSSEKRVSSDEESPTKSSTTTSDSPTKSVDSFTEEERRSKKPAKRKPARLKFTQVKKTKTKNVQPQPVPVVVEAPASSTPTKKRRGRSKR